MEEDLTTTQPYFVHGGTQRRHGLVIEAREHRRLPQYIVEQLALLHDFIPALVAASYDSVSCHSLPLTGNVQPRRLAQ
ncbi:hypothetical protein GCM10027569_03400 [Flindersiella endophytica]